MADQELKLGYDDHHFPWRGDEKHSDHAACKANRELEFVVWFPAPRQVILRPGDGAFEVICRPRGAERGSVAETVTARALLRREDLDGRVTYYPQAAREDGEFTFLRRADPGGEERYDRALLRQDALVSQSALEAIHVLWVWIRRSGLPLEAKRRAFDAGARADLDRCREAWKTTTEDAASEAASSVTDS